MKPEAIKIELPELSFIRDGIKEGKEYRVSFNVRTGHTEMAKYTVSDVSDKTIKFKGYGYVFNYCDVTLFPVDIKF